MNSSPLSFVFGDLNSKHPLWNTGRPNRAGTFLNDYCANRNFYIIAPLEPTYFPHNSLSNSILDIAISNKIVTFSADSINALSSDHNPVEITITDSNILPKSLSTCSTTNWQRFYNIMRSNTPGNPLIINIPDIDLAISNLTANVTNAINLSTKTKIIKNSHLKLPINIRNLIQAKNRFRKRWQETRYPVYKREVSVLQKQIKTLIAAHRDQNWFNLLLSLHPEDNSLYLMNKKITKKVSNIPPLNGITCTAYSNLDKSNVFAETLEESFQPNSEPYDDDHIEAVEDAVATFLASDMPIEPLLTSPIEIKDLIKKLNIRKATGPDQIPTNALKNLPINAITNITKIFNKCLIHSYFPKQWKTATVIMFPKPGQDHKNPINYRPISLLSTLSKLFEKVIYKRILIHCNANKIIPDEQFGFREKHSTSHQLLRVVNHIISGFNDKNFTGGVFLDIQKAFDRIWHDGLIYKLIQLNFPSYLIRLINEYLNDREFRVRLQDELSNPRKMEAGSPQGSVISPILYNIYTYDFPRDPFVQICLFADDSAVLAQSNHTFIIYKRLQNFLNKLEEWLTLWRIAINVNKTKAIMFHKGNIRPLRFVLEIFDSPIGWDREVKYLGVVLDVKMNFTNHIRYVTGKFWKKIHLCIPLVGRHSPLSLQNKLLLFKQVLRPIITYAAPIWFISAPTNKKKVQILQNKVLRIITNAPWFLPNSAILNDLRLDLIEDYIARLSRKFFQTLASHSNILINQQIVHAHNNGYYALPFTTSKSSSYQFFPP